MGTHNPASAAGQPMPAQPPRSTSRSVDSKESEQMQRDVDDYAAQLNRDVAAAAATGVTPIAIPPWEISKLRSLNRYPDLHRRYWSLRKEAPRRITDALIYRKPSLPADAATNIQPRNSAVKRRAESFRNTDVAVQQVQCARGNPSIPPPGKQRATPFGSGTGNGLPACLTQSVGRLQVNQQQAFPPLPAAKPQPQQRDSNTNTHGNNSNTSNPTAPASNRSERRLEQKLRTIDLDNWSRWRGYAGQPREYAVSGENGEPLRGGDGELLTTWKLDPLQYGGTRNLMDCGFCARHFHRDDKCPFDWGLCPLRHWGSEDGTETKWMDKEWLARLYSWFRGPILAPDEPNSKYQGRDRLYRDGTAFVSPPRRCAEAD
jgi:hypothetical protein